MIYRHYKGSLYFTVGFATRLSKEFPASQVQQIAMARYTEAKTPEESVLIAVLSVHDKLTGSTYYAYDTDVIEGVHTFYKDLDGNYWLRPREMFYGNLEDGTPRFVKMKGEELFDFIAKTHQRI